MSTSDTVKKPAAGRQTIRKFPAQVDYSDDVTDEQLQRIKDLAEPKDIKDSEVVSGPAW